LTDILHTKFSILCWAGNI